MRAQISVGVVLGALLAAAACDGEAETSGSGAATTSATTGGANGATTGVGGTATGGFDGTPECTTSDDCALVDDCCNCMAQPATEPVPKCDDIACLVPTCQSLGHPELAAACEVGRCVAGFPCDTRVVTCDAAEPQCAPGETASVVGTCYGPCVPADQCATVTSCDDCDLTSQVCVSETTQLGPMVHCVPIPSDCVGDTSCACMGASVCVAPFDACSDQSDGITCGCPTC